MELATRLASHEGDRLLQLSGRVLGAMKIRVRLPDGSTLKLNVEGTTTYGELLDMSGGSGNYLSLNKREPLTHDRAIRLAQLGLASGDLIYLVAPAAAVAGGVGAAPAGATR